MTTRAGFLGGVIAQIVPLPAPLGVPTPSGPALNFAVVCPLSGDEAKAGRQLVQGAQQCAYDSNQTRSPTDPLFNVRTFDDQGSVSSAPLQAQFVIDDPTIICVIGHLGGKITDAAVPRYGGSLVPLIVPASTYDPITSHGYRTVFRLPTKDSTEGLLYAQFLDQHNRPQKIVVIAQEGDYGPDVATGFMQQTSADKVRAVRLDVTPGKLEVDSLTSRVHEEEADFVFLAGLVRDLGIILDKLKSAGYTGGLGASQGFFDPVTTSDHAKSAEGLVVSSSMPPLNLVPAAFQAKNNYEQEYGPMSPVAAFGYAAAQIIVTLVRRTGANNRLLLARALNGPGPLDTIVGSFSWAPNGDQLDPEIYFYKIAKGTWSYSNPAKPTAFLLK